MFSVQWLYNIYSAKAKSRALSMFTENTLIQILSKIKNIARV